MRNEQFLIRGRSLQICNGIFLIKERETQIRNGPLLCGGGSLQIRNAPFLIRESNTRMRNEPFLIWGHSLQIRNGLFLIKEREIQIRNGPRLFGGGSLQIRNGPSLIRESNTRIRNELFLIRGRALQITNSLWYCAGTRLRICEASVRVRTSPRLRHSLWAKIYKKTSRNVYFSTLLVGLMFREDFFNTQMNDLLAPVVCWSCPSDRT